MKGKVLYQKKEKLLSLKFNGAFDGIDGLEYSRFFRDLNPPSYEEITLDLSEMETLNTVSLGLLAGTLNARPGKKTKIICNDEAMRQKLVSFGLNKHSQITGGAPVSGGLSEAPQSDCDVDAEILAVHRQLTELEPKNSLVFRDMLKFLEPGKKNL